MRYSEFGKFLFETGLRGAMEATLDDGASAVFIDYCRVADKYAFLDELARDLAPVRLHVIDGRVPDDGVVRHIPASFIRPPANVYYRENWRPAPIDRQEIASGFPDLEPLCDGFARLNGNYFKDVDRTIIRDCVETAFFFTLAALRMIQPRVAVIWNAFHPLSRASAEAARQCGIPVMYAEYGLLPGTVSIDARGQMGQSGLSVAPDAFNRVPVTEADLADARRALAFLRETGLNRREQSEPSDVAERIEVAAKGRPKVLYAGHNDFASGMIPYDDTAKRFHSPFFASSDEAGRHLLSVAEENDWLLVAKPHPFNLKGNTLKTGHNCLVMGDDNINACIDACDAVTTVLSQVSYVAMIRDKPAVMLGRNPMVNSGAAYTAGSRQDIGTAIAAALEHGITDDRRQRWNEHIARLLSAYLVRWNTDVPREIRAQPVSQVARAISAAIASGRPQELYELPLGSAEDAARTSA